MSLQRELEDLLKLSERTAPVGRAALYSSKIEELRREFAKRHTFAVGDLAPSFVLPDARGRAVSLTERLLDGPVVLTFYRGGWCPYCNLQLRAYQKALSAIEALGASLLAVSPELPDSLSAAGSMETIGFSVLSDAGNVVARTYHLAHTVDHDIRQAMAANRRLLSTINGDDSWELPVPATLVIDVDRRIALSHVDVDYRKRLEPEELIRSLSALSQSIRS